MGHCRVDCSPAIKGALHFGRWRLLVFGERTGDRGTIEVQSGSMIWIDGSNDMVAAQEQLKYGRTSGVKLGSVDPVQYAKAFGATGFQIHNANDIRPTLHKAFDTPGPVLIGVHVDYSESVKLFEKAHDSSII